MTSPANATTDQLLAALRRHTSRPAMTWSTPPHPLAGGFWAEMYVIELTAAPPQLAGRLVARIMPDPTTAAFEASMQRHLTRHGFPAPSIRCAGGPSSDLDRAWSVMDLATGQPLLAGLSGTKAIKQAPTLLRRLPDVLAEAAATLHRCPLDGLHASLAGQSRPLDVDNFLGGIAARARAIGRDDLARTAELLAATSPEGGDVICHGDLHPFNLLVDGNQWTLIDWSTAVVADPHYDLAFTALMLSNPPLGGPAPVRAATRAIGTRLATRFLRSYEYRTGRPIDAARLAWGRRAHALRALVEVASWEASGQPDTHRGHPWRTMRPVFEAHLNHGGTMAPKPSTRPPRGAA